MKSLLSGDNLLSQEAFIESLGAGALLRHLLAGSLFGRGPLGQDRQLWVLYRITPTAQRLLAGLKRLGFFLRIQEMDYDFYDDVRLPDGTRSLEELHYHVPARLLAPLETDGDYIRAVRSGLRRDSHERYLRVFLSKRIFEELSGEVRSILVASWFFRTRFPSKGAGQAILYLPGDWRFALLKEYAQGAGVHLMPLRGLAFPWRDLLRPGRAFLLGLIGELGILARGFRTRKNSAPRVAVEMYFQGIGKDLLCHTDFFWYRRQRFPAGTVFGYFAHPQDQPTPERQALLRERGIGWITQAGLWLRMAVPVRRLWRGGEARLTGRFAFLKPLVREFYDRFEGWVQFFKSTGTRIHVSSTDCFPHSEAVHAAIHEAGGVSVSLQRSADREPRLMRRTAVDVHFGYSPAVGLSELLSGSWVRQFVVAGHPYDDAFEAARERSRALAQRLRQAGASFIVCFMDENEGVHPKLVGGRRQIQGDYRFLCERLEEDSSLGLVLKPKRPDLLPDRLGPVWPRLKRWMDAGRCLLLNSDSSDRRLLPCVGSSGADVAISLLDGTTAGLQSFLAGTRTLLLGRGQDQGLFKALQRETVVFDSWGELWEAVKRLRIDPDHPGIGNWEPVIDRLASGRDGKTSERIAEYLGWLLKAFEQGSPREEALRCAGKRYEQAWGPSWVQELTQPASREAVSRWEGILEGIAPEKAPRGSGEAALIHD
ncbi:MAG: hypothetical protein HYS41_01635 [Candidatus Omnitrophica bacterium]|nr:hypothetical protein [Candidatus Omnitrophota bacterium]